MEEVVGSIPTGSTNIPSRTIAVCIRLSTHPSSCVPAKEIRKPLPKAWPYHEITTQIPSAVHLAVPRGSYHRIKLSVPVTVYRFDSKTFHDGLEC